MKKILSYLALASTLAVGGVVVTDTMTAPPAEAAWVIGHHYEWNRIYRTCWRVNHVRYTMWDAVWGRHTNLSAGQVPIQRCYHLNPGPFTR